MSNQSLSTKPPFSLQATIGLSLGFLALYFFFDIIVTVVYAGILYSKEPSIEAGRLIAMLETDGLLVSIIPCISAPIVSGLMILCVKLNKRLDTKEYLGFVIPGRKEFLFWTMIFVGFGACWNITSYLLGRAIVPEVMIAIYRSAPVTILLWMAFVIAAPMFEELLFRGFLFKGLQNSKLGNVGAIFFTALPWAVIHFQYDTYEVASIFLLGIIFGIARIKTNSVTLTMFMHMIMNIIATSEARFYAGFY